ncbi:MAG TPA: hypothetical protein PLD10_10520 [Rhodopila sp.]|nr:hypothetical protein [Rhodopila sp.]
MRRFLRTIANGSLAFGLLFHTGLSAVAGTPTAEYLAARDRAIAALADNSDDVREQAAVDDLQRRVCMIVGPIGIPGFPEPGDSNVKTLSPGVDLGRLDGVTARDAAGTTVYVTTLPLLRAWLKGDARRDGSLPKDAAAAFRTDDFYTQAISPDAHATIFGALPLAAEPTVHGAAALLVEFAQDGPAPNPPDRLVVSFVLDGRAILLVRNIRLAQIPACRTAWDQENKAAQDVLDSYTKTGARDRAMFGRYLRLDDAANDHFIRCFGARFRTSGDYAATVQRAQALFDRASRR